MPEEPTNQKSQYLNREEIRTMEKDIAHLRELESEAAREKIAEIKTGEEAVKEAERLEQSRQAAQEREESEVEAKRKKEELAEMREERAASVLNETGASVAEAEEKKELLRAQLKEAQLKEEENRRKFLEDVAAKAEGRAVEEKPYIPPVPPIPPPIPPSPAPAEPKKSFKFPLPSLKIPKPKLPSMPTLKVEGYFPAKSPVFEKIWIRIIVSLLVLAILAAIGTFWYWYLVIKPGPAATSTAPPVPPAVQKVTKKQPEIVQQLLGEGYYLPISPKKTSAIILHSGSSENGDPYDIESVIELYRTAKVATHYLIGRNGAIYQLAPDNAIAYHAGAGKMPDGRGNVNNFSIGISLVYKETESPNDAQYESLGWLVKGLKEKYDVTTENILGYKDIAPGKTTPWNFDLDKLKLLISYVPLPASPNNGAEFIFERLALEEKIGQLLIVGIDGVKLTPELDRFMKTARPGGILLLKKNIENAAQIEKLIQDLQRISLAETGLPLFIAVDQEGGAVSRIDFAKEKTGQSEIKNADQAYDVGLERGKELRELGINLNLAPVLDSSEWSTDFLYERSFQKNQEELTSSAKALILGQKTAGILTAIKHFPGYGGIFPNPEKNLNILAHLPEISQFQAVMEANPSLIMVASVVYPIIEDNLPFAFSENGIAFLKNKLGDGPLVITDDLSQDVFSKNFSLKERATMPLTAGVDILLFSSWEAGIIEAVKDLPEEVINKAALRVVKLKQDYFK